MVERSIPKPLNNSIPQPVAFTIVEIVDTDDARAWSVFTLAIRSLPMDKRVPFALLVLGPLIDGGHVPSAVLLAVCDGALIELRHPKH
jgi:hypothetical protein